MPEHSVVDGDSDATWIATIAVSDLEPGDVTEVTVGSHRVAVYDAHDGIYATDARCTHAGARLCDGYFDRHVIECPLHQGCFDVRDGRPLGAPVQRPLACWPVRVVKGWVEIRLPRRLC